MQLLSVRVTDPAERGSFPPKSAPRKCSPDRIRDCGKQGMVQLSLGYSFAFVSRRRKVSLAACDLRSFSSAD
jgi:hypothetical protein